jgi:hypothetical protein
MPFATARLSCLTFVGRIDVAARNRPDAVGHGDDGEAESARSAIARPFADCVTEGRGLGEKNQSHQGAGAWVVFLSKLGLFAEGWADLPGAGILFTRTAPIPPSSAVNPSWRNLRASCSFPPVMARKPPEDRPGVDRPRLVLFARPRPS